MMHHSVDVTLGEWEETAVDLSLPGPYGFEIKRSFLNTPRDPFPFASGWTLNLPDVREADTMRKKCIPPFGKSYLIEHDDKKRLARFLQINDLSKQTEIALSLAYEENAAHLFLSEEKMVSYFFTPSEKGSPLLTHVSWLSGKKVDYIYLPHPREKRWLISERKENEGPWLKIVYFEQTGKVKELHRSLDEGVTYHLVCSFDYKDKTTWVKEPSGALFQYDFNEQREVVLVSTYLEDTLTPYRQEEWQWKDGQLSAKTWKDGAGYFLKQMNWSYDPNGRLIEESLTGLLEAENTPLSTYGKRWSYDALGRLASEEEDNGKKCHYGYDENGFLSSIHYLDHDTPLNRLSFSYSKEGYLIEEREEDSRASFRKWIRYSDFHPLGMSQMTEEGYFDFATQQDVLNAEEERVFSSLGSLLSVSKRNGEGRLLSQESFLYNSHHILIQKTTLDGEVTYFSPFETYTKMETSSHREIRRKDGLPLRVEKEDKGVKTVETSFSYNSLGWLEEKTDWNLYSWRYRYDPLKRKISEELPGALQDRGILFYEYNSLDQVISFKDPEGHETRKTYNVRGSPLQVHYPDGTTEGWEYDRDGSLKKKIERDKTFTSYLNDALGRVKEKSRFDAEGRLLSKTCYLYTGRFLIKEMHSNGLTIDFCYDSQGRVIENTVSPTARKCAYLYDLQGDLTATKEWWGEGENEFLLLKNTPPEPPPSPPLISWDLREERLLIYKYEDGSSKRISLDPFDRVSCLENFDIKGGLLSKEKYRYDFLHRKIEEVYVMIDGGEEKGEIVHKTFYGPGGKIEKRIEAASTPEERATSYAYNDKGQLSILTKPDGVLLCHEYDAAGRLSRFYSSDGSVDDVFRYDTEGRLIEGEDRIHQLTLRRHYDMEGKLLLESLGNGLSLEKTYDKLGRTRSIYFPDGSRVDHAYNQEKLASLQRYSSLGDKLYSFETLEFNEKGLPLHTQLPGQGGKVSYEWTQEGRLASVHSLHFSQRGQFDEKGHLTRLNTIDPLGSYETAYGYDLRGRLTEEKGVWNKSHIYDPSGDLLPKGNGSTNALHQLLDKDLSYDLNGYLVSKRGKEGELLDITYDALGRVVKITKGTELLHEYVYDSFHRRIFDKKQAYLYDGEWELGNFAQGELRILAGSFYEGEHSFCAAIEIEGKHYAPVYDLKGSLALLIDPETSLPVETHRFTAFGEEIEPSPSLSPWLFWNKRHDPATGWIFFGRREYDPALKRWTTPDPFHLIDGENRYAFAHNNPLAFKDRWGLKSVADQWKAAGEFLSKVFRFFSKQWQKLMAYKDMGTRKLTEHLMGSSFMLLLGYTPTSTQVGVWGKGEVNDKVRVSFINGILTDYDSLAESLEALSTSHGGVYIHYVYRPTKGWVHDLLHSLMTKLGMTSSEAIRLASEWKKMIGEMGGVEGGGKIIHYAHSIGVVETMRALSMLSPEEQALIQVYAFGSPHLVKESPHHHIHHYLSVRDGVALFDPVHFVKAWKGLLPNVTLIGSFVGIPLIDHFFCNETYRDVWKSMGRTFVDWYGSLI